jgi:predicted nucleotide-binding protein
VWTEVKSRLEQFGLVVEEFNSESVAGEHVIRRLEDMLDRAVFGVLILSAEDEAHVASNSEAQKMATLRARQNVIHEAGLCQGRLGFRRVVLLREKGIEMPSNLAGLQDIPYDATSLTEAIAEIQRTLVREALIPAG